MAWIVEELTLVETPKKAGEEKDLAGEKKVTGTDD